MSVGDDAEKSLGAEGTFAALDNRSAPAEISLGDQRTIGGDSAGVDTLIDGLETVDLEARYAIEGTLGQGGMGAVLLATDTRLGRKVAIKRILGEAAGNKTAVARFLNEAKAIAALNHPNVVQIHDYGRAKDGPFLIMEYVDGGSLLDRCKQGPIPPAEAVELACHICDGLAKAHDRRIIHRDIKPANILLTADGIPKLTDFGLAKSQGVSHGHGVTGTGVVMGTPGFMPPEQQRDAAEVDHRSDLWSLAATVYQMVTGQGPELINLQRVPPQLRDAIGRALEDRKEDRFQTAREMRDALKGSLRAAASPAATIRQGHCPACDTPNDATRKFCRNGNCAAPLEAACLSCATPVPLWEEICGDCGARQAALATARRGEMAEDQARAEGLLGDLAFAEAAAIAGRLRDESHPRLAFLGPWAERFLEEVEATRSQVTERAVASLAEAAAHERASDYQSAVAALESVPEAMRSVTPPGATESPLAMLLRVRRKQQESDRLEGRIRERIVAKSFDGLMDDVEKLLTLRPDRRDVLKLRSQLEEREERQAAARLELRRRQEAMRDESLAAARSLMATHDYKGALDALTRVPAEVMTAEVDRCRAAAELTMRRALTLAEKIRGAVAANRLDDLLESVDAYLKLMPEDADVIEVRRSLVAREERMIADYAARVAEAQQLEQACRFVDAVQVVEGVPPDRRGDATNALLRRCRAAADQRAAALKSLAGGKATDVPESLRAATGYRRLVDDQGLEDSEFEDVWKMASAALVAVQRRRRLFAIAKGAAVAVLACASLVIGLMAIRSRSRAAAMVGAVASGRWDEALAIDPGNVVAYEGRSRSRLAAQPPDVDGAFADIGALEGITGTTAATKSLRAAAHGVRAGGLAREGRLEDADQDLAAAMELDAAQTAVTDARSEIAAALLSRAQERARSDQLKEASLDIEKAVRLDAGQRGAAGQRDVDAARQAVANAWLARAKKHLESGEYGDADRAVSAASRISPRGMKGIQEARQAIHEGLLGEVTRAAGMRDVTALRQAAATALEFGCDRKRLLVSWQKFASQAIANLDAAGLGVACVEAKPVGLAAEQEAAWWLQFGIIGIERDDASSVRTAADSWAALGRDAEVANRFVAAAWPKSAAGLWYLFGGRVAAKADRTALETACAESKRHGVPPANIIELWMRYGATVAMPPHEDGEAVRAAVDAALAAGAVDGQVASLRAWGLVLEGAAAIAAGDDVEGVRKACEAIAIAPANATAMLEGPGRITLRKAVGADFRARFGKAITSGDWNAALDIMATAGAVEPKAAEWIVPAIESRAGGMSSLPVAVLRRLPPEAGALLQPSVVAALPSSSLAALPAGVIVKAPPLRTSIGLEMRLVPAGTFTMGDAGGGADETPHAVTLTRAFYVGVTEITRAQWTRVMGGKVENVKDETLPMNAVSWGEVVGFCRRMSQRPEEQGMGRVYRLPTEAEWEWACRGGATTAFSFGAGDADLGRHAWFRENSGNSLHPVGGKQPNAFGLYDMHGSLWEWCSDWYGLYPKGAVTDPTGPFEREYRVIRGGCYFTVAKECTSASRSWNGADGGSHIGFRVVLSPSESHPPDAGK